MVTVLEREMYTEAHAARLLSVPPSTLHYWLEGGERRGKQYPPILREKATGSRAVTWGEFTEAGLLREYRRTHRIPMEKLRMFVDLLRNRFGIPYPLADRRPYVSGKDLVLDAQTAADLDAEFCLVAVANDQLLLTAPASSFVQRVQWDGNLATAWRPDPNDKSPVRVNPNIRFGRPAIKGISTDVIWEQREAGENVKMIAEVYQLTVRDVRWALSYENSLRAA